ncbi:unnamed protein product, partial [Rotaria magnacalcarata]
EHLVSPLVLSKAMTNGANGSDRTIFTQFNDPRVHRAEIPGANGIATAWSIARLYSGLIGDLDNGGFKRILNEDTLKLATRSNTPKDEIDLSMQMQRSFAMGFLLYDDILPQFGPNSFGHGGFGGSIGFCAPSKNFSFAFAMNRLDVESVNDQRIGPMLNRIAEYLS